VAVATLALRPGRCEAKIIRLALSQHSRPHLGHLLAR
jgi:hypothetical protein